MSERSRKIKLTGAASWLAILGAAFFWMWLDRGMFGSALLSSADQEAIEVATVVLMAANIMSFVVVYAVVARKGVWSDWPVKLVAAAALAGVLGGLICVLFRGADDALLSCIGGALLGAAMGFFNVVWGLIAVSQGVEKTVLHISGAWGISLFFNAAMAWAPVPVESLAVLLLPLLSLACYAILGRLQSRDRYAIEFRYGSDEPSAKRKKAFGIDMQFLVVILVFCCAFGFVSWFGAAGDPVSTGTDAEYLAIARCAVALIFFIVCCLFSMKNVGVLLRGALSLVAAGVVVLTIGVFIPPMNEPGRILVAMGYSGFDVLVWTLISYYSRASVSRAVQVIAVAMIAEQVGILLGIVSGIVVDRIAIGTFESSIFLAAMNYALLLACFALLRRYDSRPILSDDAPAETSLSGDSRIAVDRFAENAQLTSREKQVAYFLAEGRNVPYISKKLFVSENTVKSHVRHIYEKSGVHNRQELLDELEAIRHP